MVHRQPNPYHPGFNQPPAVLAGREQLLDDVREALEVAAYDHRTPRPLVLIGPRGVGKTVTLGEAANEAARTLSWPTVHVEVRPGGFVGELVTRLREVTVLLEGSTPAPPDSRGRRARLAGGKVGASAFGVGVEGEVAFEPGPADPPAVAQLGNVLTTAAQTAASRDAGILLTLDELHTADPDELGLLAAVLQEQVPYGWPLVVAAAALPSLRNTRGRRKLPTYLERAQWHDMGPLPLEAARRALAEPAALAGRPMAEEALAALLDLAGGYPYALQVAGHFAWRASAGAPEITHAHAQAAAPRIEADLAQLFTGRWEDASAREREYLTAVASVQARDGAATGADVAREMGAAAKELSYLRDRLIKKGTLWSSSDGVLHFITPGMGEWIRRTRA